MAHGGVSGTGLRWGKAADPETSQELSSPSELAERCRGAVGVSDGAFLPKFLLVLRKMVKHPGIATEVMGTKLFSSCEWDYFKIEVFRITVTILC